MGQAVAAVRAPAARVMVGGGQACGLMMVAVGVGSLSVVCLRFWVWVTASLAPSLPSDAVMQAALVRLCARLKLNQVHEL